MLTQPAYLRLIIEYNVEVKSPSVNFAQIKMTKINAAYMAVSWAVVRRGNPAAMLVPCIVTMSNRPSLGFTLHKAHSQLQYFAVNVDTDRRQWSSG